MDTRLPAAPPESLARLLPLALQEKTVGFCRLLRQHGFRPGMAEARDAVAVAEVFLCTDFSAFHDGMRALFCGREEDWERFDTLFADYWCPEDGARRIVSMQKPLKRQQRGAGQGIAVTTGVRALEDQPEVQGETRLSTGASGMEVLDTLDLAALPTGRQGELEAAAERFWRWLALNRPRRLRGRKWRRRLDFRRTMRRNLSRGGEPLTLMFRGNRARKPRLVALLDVSGSMEAHSFFYLRLLHALQQRFRHAATFVFSTGLVEVTGAMGARDVGEALRAASRLRLGWNGGTRIGDCLRQLVESHGSRLLRPDAALLILSDGLDVGEPEVLAQALGRAARRVEQVIWLNPLLSTRGYEPTARGMAAALPLVDVFASAQHLEQPAAWNG